MRRSWNLLLWLGFLICVGAFFGYFYFFVRFPTTRDVPWASWLLFAGGLVCVWGGLRRALRRPDAYRGKIFGPVLAVLSLVVTGFFGFYTLVLSSQLPAAAGAPGVGDLAPDFALPDQNGNFVSLAELLGEGEGANWVLLVFYRGYW